MSRLKTLTAAALAATTVGAIAIVSGAQGDTAIVSSPKTEQSLQLTKAPAPSPLASGRRIDAAGARSLASSQRQSVPLPEGGNFNGIRWEELAGPVSAAEVEIMTEFNAACQWLRAAADGREKGVAEKILGDVPNWNAIREIGFPAGDPRQLEECRQASQRERAYAGKLGLLPSS